MGEKMVDWKNINGIKNFKDLELELKRIELKERCALREFRAFYSNAIFWVTVLWVVAILVVTILCGKDILCLDNKVLIALISTTTVNVFAFFVLVVKYMFQSPKEPNPVAAKPEIVKAE
jgi:hypothetical protein